MNDKIKLSIWLGARLIDEDHINIINELNNFYNIIVYGNKSIIINNIIIEDYEKAMSNKFKSDILLIIDEPWAIDFGDANCKILWIKSNDAIIFNNHAVYKQILQLKGIICNNFNIKNNFLYMFKTISKDCIFVRDDITVMIKNLYKESLWNPMQPFGSDL